jgi:drug/metabolite transporter (DMT)-like permease
VLGLVLALFSGAFFSMSNVLVRKGVSRSGEAFSIIPISAFIGTLFFGIPIIISGQVKQLLSISWLGLAALIGAGLLHFILGRTAAYVSIRLIGANRSVPIFISSVLIASLWGIFFLGESVTPPLILAIILVVGGTVLIGTAGNSAQDKSDMPRASLVKGVVLAISAALFWGSSPMLVKIGIREISSPLLATFISYMAASIVIGFALIFPANTRTLKRLNRYSLIPIVLASIAVAVAQILRYQSLAYSPVTQFEPVMHGAHILLVFPLSFLINRQLEAFNIRILIGAIAIVAGVFLIFWAV